MKKTGSCGFLYALVCLACFLPACDAGSENPIDGDLVEADGDPDATEGEAEEEMTLDGDEEDGDRAEADDEEGEEMEIEAPVELPLCLGLDSLPAEPPLPGIPGQKEDLPPIVPMETHERHNRLIILGGGLAVTVQVAPFSFEVRRQIDDALLLASAVGGADKAFAPLSYTEDRGEYSLFLHTWWQFESRENSWTGSSQVEQICPGEDRIRFQIADSRSEGKILFAVGPFYKGAVRIAASVASDETQPNRLALSFQSPADEHYAGFGERFNSVDQRGRTVGHWAEEGGLNPGDMREVLAPDEVPEFQYPGGETTSYAPIPFFISNYGYGLLADVPQQSHFDLAESHEDIWRVKVEATELSLILFDGPSPAEVLKRYTDRTGRSQVPRPWVFAPWNMHWGGDKSETFRTADVPSSVVPYWTAILPNGSHRGSEEGITARNDRLHDLGYKSLCYLQPRVDQDRYEELWTEGAEKDFFIRTPDGEPYLMKLLLGALNVTEWMISIVDYTVPGVEVWWHRILQDTVDMHFDGMMYDFGEYTPPDALFSDGNDGLYWHNPFPLIYQRAGHRFFMGLDDDPEDGLAPDYVWFHRSGYAGSQHWTWAMWGGDPEADWSVADGLPASVTAGINNGLSGMPFWGSDIGGFHAIFVPPPTPELLKRWVQFGAFSGLMRDSTSDDQIREGTPPHIFDSADITFVVRKFQKLRTQLVPYIFNAAWEAHHTGLPLMRAPLLHFPEDPKVWDMKREFLFGADIYVAPVVEEGALDRKLYLPEGKWIEFWAQTEYDGTMDGDGVGGFRIGGEVIEGGREITVEAPIDQIPLFVRAGAIIPTVDPRVDTHVPSDPPEDMLEFVTTAEAMAHRLHAWIFADEGVVGSAKLSDGSQLSYEFGDVAMAIGRETEGDAEDEKELILQIVWPAPRPVPDSIDGLEYVADADPLTLAPGQWTYSPSRHALALHGLPGSLSFTL